MKLTTSLLFIHVNLLRAKTA